MFDWMNRVLVETPIELIQLYKSDIVQTRFLVCNMEHEAVVGKEHISLAT